MPTIELRRSMQSLSSATSQCSAEFSQPATREHIPCFVQAQLHEGVLSLRYAAHAGNATGINGDSLLFSLMKRLAQDGGEAFEPPQIRLQLESYVGDQPDTNCHLIVEALTSFDLPVARALSCAHLDNVALSRGYAASELNLDAHGHGHLSYTPLEAARRMRADFGL